MTAKYIDIANILVALIPSNITIILAFVGGNYYAKLRPWKNHNCLIKKWGKPQTLLIAIDGIFTVSFLGLEIHYQTLELLDRILDYFWNCDLLWIVVCLVLSLIGSFVVIPVNQDTYSGAELDQKYVKFTEAVGSDKDVYVIAGDFGFLGRVPLKNINKQDCLSLLDKMLTERRPVSCDKSSEDSNCIKCALSKEQLKQLVEKAKEKSINLKILCRRPKSDDNEYIIMIGYLLELFPEVDIRFYNDIGNKLPLRGRIIGTARGDRRIFFHYTTKESGQYQKLTDCDDSSPEGKTYIGLYSILWDSAEQDKTYLKLCRDAYRSHIKVAKDEPKT